jgi:hypothetical protein
MGRLSLKRPKISKRQKNLEEPAGMSKIHGFSNSFAALDDENLVHNAYAAGISLGASAPIARKNVGLIRGVETKRLHDFHVSHPDVFLPSDINLTMEDILEEKCDNSRSKSNCHEDYNSDVYDSEWPWTEVSTRRKSKKKLQFK